MYVYVDYIVYSFIPDISIAPLQVHYNSEVRYTGTLYAYLHCIYIHLSIFVVRLISSRSAYQLPHSVLSNPRATGVFFKWPTKIP